MPYSVSPQRNFQQLQPGDVEAQVELLALHAAELGDDEVAQLVDENDKPQADGHLEDGQPVSGSEYQAAIKCTTQRDTSWRAQRSSCQHLLSVGLGSKLWCSRMPRQAGTICVEAKPAGQEGRHGRLVGAVEHGPGRAAARRRLQAQPQGRRSARSRAARNCNSHRPAPIQLRRHARAAARASQARTGSAASCPAGSAAQSPSRR